MGTSYRGGELSGGMLCAQETGIPHRVKGISTRQAKLVFWESPHRIRNRPHRSSPYLLLLRRKGRIPRWVLWPLHDCGSIANGIRTPVTAVKAWLAERASLPRAKFAQEIGGYAEWDREQLETLLAKVRNSSGQDAPGRERLRLTKFLVNAFD